MWRLILKLALLATFGAALFGALEVKARRMYRDGTDLFLKEARLAEVEDSTRALVLGASHAEYGIDPADLDVPTYNLAFPSQDLYYDRHLLERQVDRMKELRCVVVAIALFDFAYHLEAENVHLVREYESVFDIPPRSGQNLGSIIDRSVYLRHHGTFVAHVLTGKVAEPFHVVDAPHPRHDQPGEWLTSTGFRSIDTAPPAAERDAECAARVKFHVDRRQQDGAPPGKLEGKELRSMLDLLASRHLGTLIVMPPTSEAYRTAYPVNLRREFDETLARLLESHPGVRYLDLSAAEGFGEGDFVDCDHLNRRGAAKLTRLLAPEIDRCVERGAPR